MLLATCATCSELPSYISTMMLTANKKKLTNGSGSRRQLHCYKRSEIFIHIAKNIHSTTGSKLEIDQRKMSAIYSVTLWSKILVLDGNSEYVAHE